MKSYAKSFLCFAFIILLLPKVCSAQIQRLTFRHLPSPAGASANGGLAGVQDRQGYMWFALVGVHRYNGYKYTSYFNDPVNPNSLANDWVEALCADHNGFIWIGTRLSGLDRLDPTTGHFTHFRHDPKNSNTISSDIIRTLLEDREGMLWIGTDSGLNKYDPQTGVFRHFNYNPNDSHSLSCNHVFKLYEDRQGTLWVGTGSIWYGEGGETDEGGLNRFDKNTGKFIRFLHEPGNPHSLIDNKVRAIFEDSRGTFWVGTAGDGLHTMNRTSGTFERHRYDAAHPEKLSRPAQKKGPSVEDVITFITEDVSGTIWIGTFLNGVNRYDPLANKTEHYPNFGDTASGGRASSASWAYTSRDGILWIGYMEGIFRINPLQNSIPYFNTGINISSIVADTSGMLWYATDKELVRRDQNTGTEQVLIHDSVRLVYEDRQGVLWVATGNDLNYFDRRTGKFVLWRPGFNKYSILCIYEDRQGAVWIGTHHNKGLILLNKQDGFFENYRYNHQDTTSFANNSVSCIYEGKSGNLWIGTLFNGLKRFQTQTKRFQSFLEGASVFSLCQDSKGTLWVGTATGLYHSNSSLDSFSRFTDPNTVLPENIMVNGLLEDSQGALWINASDGIYRLNPSQAQIVIYSRHGGRFIYGPLGSYKGKNNELFFGAPNGYYAFFPEQLKENKRAPQIVLSAFRIADQPVIPGKESPLKKPLSQTKEIRLRYNQDVFSFDFAGIHYANPERNQHLFMLEGLDIIWHKAGEEKTAYYYNVPPGHYVFRIKTANSDGVWAEKAIVIIIDPPWWRTWWAYTLFALLLAGLIYVFIQYRISKIRVQHEIILQKHRAAELEMQALRAQMNPHFIFNCLNAINGYILNNEAETAADYLTKFSRLIRMVLNNSQKQFISLEEELETLGLYLYMESLRFKDNFNYEIKCNDTVDAFSIFIPPMLLQPFIENAIWHGLMNKERDRKLIIGLHFENDVLHCTIADNGVGRKKAAQLKSKSAEKNKSMGMDITRNRMALLNHDLDGQSFFEINDLEDEYGKPAGTSVSLKIKNRNITIENISEVKRHKIINE